MSLHLGTRAREERNRGDPVVAFSQVARNLLDPVDGFLRNATHLIHDRDPLFAQVWTNLLESGGVKCVPIPARARTGATYYWDTQVRARDMCPLLPRIQFQPIMYA